MRTSADSCCRSDPAAVIIFVLSHILSAKPDPCLPSVVRAQRKTYTARPAVDDPRWKSTHSLHARTALPCLQPAAGALSPPSSYSLAILAAPCAGLYHLPHAIRPAVPSGRGEAIKSWRAAEMRLRGRWTLRITCEPIAAETDKSPSRSNSRACFQSVPLQPKHIR